MLPQIGEKLVTFIYFNQKLSFLPEAFKIAISFLF